MTLPLKQPTNWRISCSGRAEIYLSYKNVAVRNAASEDAPILAGWWNDGSVMVHAGFPNGLGTTQEKIIADIAQDTDETRRRLILLYCDAPIGEMCYRNIGNHIADIGIKICNSSYQEQGIGRIALSMLILHLFEIGYSKIVLDTNLKNTRAQHVYEKLGFRKLKVNVDSWKNQLGQRESSVDYVLTEAEFINFAV